ncbi:MAG: glycosyltransferase [Pseudomonadota bacterium]
MDIAVVVPAFNRRYTLARALDSIAVQSYSAVQTVVVDDGSKDKTADFVRQYYPQVELICQSNLGVSAARNNGIEHTSAEWIAFLDSDDAWLPNKLELQREALARRPEFLVCHTDEIWIRNGVRVNPMKYHAKPDGDIFSECLPRCCVSPSSVLIHRSVFDAVGAFNTDLPACEDYDLWLRMFCIYSVLLVSDKLLVKYGGHQDQLSRKHWGMDRFRVASLDRLLQSGVLDNDQYERARKTLLAKCAILITGAKKRNRSQTAREYLALSEKYGGVV